MGMSDAQFKAFLRVALRDLTEALQAATPEEKDAIIKALADDFRLRSVTTRNVRAIHGAR